MACLLFTFACPLFSFSQDPYFNTITESDGLPSNDVYDLFQDSKGFIWVATNSGLSRFDGHSFKNYFSPALTSLPGSNIFEDPMGRIWYENFDGYNYYVEDDSLRAFPQDSSAGFIRSALVGNYLVIPHVFGLQVYDIKTLAPLKYLPYGGRIILTRITGSRYHLLFSDESNGSTIACTLEPDLTFSKEVYSQPDQPGKNTEPLSVAGQNYLIISGKSDTDPAAIRPGNYEVIPLPREVGFLQVCNTIDNLIWIADIRGLILYDPAAKKVLNPKKIFPDRCISAMLKDKEGNYWLGTLGKGLLFISDFNSKFLHPAQIPLTKVAVAGQSLFFGTQDGILFEYHGDEEGINNFYENEDHHAIDAIVPMSETGQLYVGDPFLKILSAEGPFLPTKTKSKVVLKDAVYLSKNYFAVCEPFGLSLIPTQAGESNKPDEWDSLFAAHHHAEWGNFSRIINGRGRAVCKLPDRNAFVCGTAAGLFHVSPGRIQEITRKGKKVLPSQLFETNGFIYGLTTLGEMFALNPQLEIVSLKGLPEQGPWLKMKIQNGRCFLLSYYNLYELTLGGNSVLRFSQIPGVNPTTVNDLALWKDNLALTTDEGLVIIDPQKSVSRKEKPSFRINSFEIAGRKMDAGKKAFVSASENEVLIEYSIFSYRTGGNFPLWYRINESNWQAAPADMRSLTLPSLKPGDYRIEFCLGEAGITPAAVVEFEIGKPLWQRTWFLILCVLSVSGVLIFIFTLRNKKIRLAHLEKLKQQELESDLRQSKLTALRSQMNPHFFFNALNSIQSYITLGDQVNASTYLGKFSKLTRKVLEMSEKEFVPLSEEIETLSLYLELEKARFEEPFYYSVYLEEGIQPEKILVPSLFLQPFCENAVKHGLLHKRGEKRLLLSFRLVDEWLEVLIDDNGIGRQRSFELNRKKAGAHQSFSTQANQQRVDLLNRNSHRVEMTYIDKTGKSGEPEGTTVKMLIKI